VIFAAVGRRHVALGPSGNIIGGDNMRMKRTFIGARGSKDSPEVNSHSMSHIRLTKRLKYLFAPKKRKELALARLKDTKI